MKVIREPPANRGRCLPKEALMSDWKNASQGLGVGFELRTERRHIKTDDKAEATPETQVSQIMMNV